MLQKVMSLKLKSWILVQSTDLVVGEGEKKKKKKKGYKGKEDLL